MDLSYVVSRVDRDWPKLKRPVRPPVIRRPIVVLNEKPSLAFIVEIVRKKKCSSARRRPRHERRQASRSQRLIDLVQERASRCFILNSAQIAALALLN